MYFQSLNFDKAALILSMLKFSIAKHLFNSNSSPTADFLYALFSTGFQFCQLQYLMLRGVIGFQFVSKCKEIGGYRTAFVADSAVMASETNFLSSILSSWRVNL
jgi:hypothetical protein